ncbi:MAG: acyl-CoA dehydrogenase [Halieaceae bacterium]|nr:acyl-CoA dehydrogenase [Halieaceae bacterium]MCP4841909.1 acyl-CoA dehydrogenase [Halieaceae bacterium]MDG2410600.1 MaoC family dehydratase N-terminal domain-containing protein [Halioglobus sp.]
MIKLDIDGLKTWIGRSEMREDSLVAAPVDRLSATLDHPSSLAGPAGVLPPCWHWLYFHHAERISGLGADGHPKRGGFLPPVPLPRRMWASSRVTFLSPLMLGDTARRHSTIIDVRQRLGGSGALVFVTLKHEIFARDKLVIEEIQDLVYRDRDITSGRTLPAPDDGQWHRKITPDSVMLFRYSALTFNSHRIHFDRDYATAEEGYSSLVVQGPLTATLLLDLLRRQLPTVTLACFEFRAVAPVLEGSDLTLRGRRDGELITLWASDAQGNLTMEARARVAINQSGAGD